MLLSREAVLSRLRGGTGTCRHPQPMRSAWSGSRAAVWRFCARPGLLVLRVWPGGSDRAGECRLGLDGGFGGLWRSRGRGGSPVGDTGGAETPSPGGWGAFVFCVELGRSLGFCPCSLGMRAGGEGARPALGFSTGCERGDNRRREPSSASTARRARLFRGPHCLKESEAESEAGGARGPEGRRPPGLPGLRGGGPGQLWALRQWVEAMRQSPLQPPQGCVSARCFWRELGGGWPRAASPRGAGPPRRTVGPAHPVAAHARGLPSVERFSEIRKGAGSRGAGPGAGA